MTHDPSPNAPAGRRWRRKAALVVAVLFLLAAVIVIGAIYREAARWDRALRGAGLPSNAEEFIASYGPIPPEEDAAPLYDEAFALAEGADPNGMRSAELFEQRDLDEHGGIPPHSDADRERTRKFVTIHKDAIEAARRAAERPRARFDLDLARGAFVELPHLARMRNLARILALDCEVSTWDGDAARAVDDQRVMLHMAQALEGEPLLICQLVNIAIQGIAYARVPELLGAGILSDGDLQRLADAYAREPYQDLARMALAGELQAIALTLERYGRGSDENFDIDSTKTRPAILRILQAPWRRYEMNVMTDYLDWLLFAPPPSWHELLDACERNDAAGLRPSVAARETMPAIARGVQAFARADACSRIVRVAIGVERFRLAEGRLPYDLDKLATFFPDGPLVDPFDGRPLRYEPRADSYIVYSVSMNRTDEHGVIGKGPYEGDWVLAVRHEAGDAEGTLE